MGLDVLWYDADQINVMQPTDAPENDIPNRELRGRRRNPRPMRRPIERVWEFLRNLLLDHKTCPSLIYWQDYSTKTFKLRDREKIAKLWGEKKNKRMTYQNLSRAMRYYYHHHIILPVPNQKDVYRFDFNASGVETSNPNFGVPVDI